jgi:hypothetical protein
MTGATDIQPVLTLRCQDGKLIAKLYRDGDHLWLEATHVLVASAEPHGLYDVRSLPRDERPADVSPPVIQLGPGSRLANASTWFACGCRKTVLIQPSSIRAKLAELDADDELFALAGSRVAAEFAERREMRLKHVTRSR